MTPIAVIILLFGSTAFAQDQSTVMVLEVTPVTTDVVTEATTLHSIVKHEPTNVKTGLIIPIHAVHTEEIHHETTTVIPKTSSIIMTAILTTKVPVVVVVNKTEHEQNDEPGAALIIPVIPVLIANKPKHANKTGKLHSNTTKRVVIGKTKTTPARREEVTTDAPVTRLIVQAEGGNGNGQDIIECFGEKDRKPTNNDRRTRRQFGMGGFGGGFGGMGMGGMGMGGMGMGMPVGGMVAGQVSQPLGFGGPIVQDTVSVQDTIVGK